MNQFKLPSISPTEEFIKNTTTRCPVCEESMSGTVVKVRLPDGSHKVVMRRTCLEHGFQETLLSSDARFYWHAQGRPENRGSCGCGTSCSPVGGGRDAMLGSNATDLSRIGEFQKLSTCVALIEIVNSCNLACPTCFADSPRGVSGNALEYYNFDNITNRIHGVLQKKRHIEILQLSGGEPTIHPEFLRLVRWIRENKNIDYLVINTNGVRFAKDQEFVDEMGRLFKEFDNIQLYLQFDGPQQQGQAELRGADLRELRVQAIANCAKVGIPITLAMTVNRLNLGHMWSTVEFAKSHLHIRGVSFQPMFLSGRTPTLLGARLPDPITVADIVKGLSSQSEGLMDTDDFTPLPCGDPNCAAIGWLFRMGGAFYSPQKHGVNVASLQGRMPDRINYSIEDLSRCGCDNTALGDLMRRLELKESNAFRLFIKPFMDSRTWDQDRIDRCCTHVIRPDGKLDSFCRYYAER
jgi:uncharacterized radical SAM superfamily Fe-S cluster-containing enzyme